MNVKNFKCYLLVIGCLISFLVKAQTFTFCGYAVDMKSGESLVGATIWDLSQGIGAVSNNSGFFQMKLAKGKHNFIIRFVGYETQDLVIDLHGDTIVNIPLSSKNILEEVIVFSDNKQDFLFAPVMSMHNIRSAQIKKIPMILGETDVLKAIQFLPGVTMTNEGQTGVSVRGGSPDQTLVLLDGVPMYNTNHLFGYLSNFNSDFIRSGKLYKGGLPARYGGRLSSIFDIASKEGNYQHNKGIFSVGTMAGRIMIEGPVKKGKASYFIAGRRTWLDLPLRLNQKLNQENEFAYNFWDIYTKIKWNINFRNKLQLCVFKGSDKYIEKVNGLVSDTDNRKYSFGWGNQSALLKWEHLFKNNIYSEFLAYVNYYDQKMTSKTNSDSAKLQVSYNHIHNYSIQSNYYLSTVNNQKIKFGFQLSQQYLTPNIYDFLTPDSKVLEDSVRMISNENAIFVEDEMILSHKIKLNIGTRFSQYHVGKKNYWGVEPRLAGSFHIFKKATFKISYSRMKQFVHVIPGTGNGFPVDLWITSTEKIEPGISDLFSIGVFCQPSENINISVEGYYSAMANVVRYFETDYVYQSSGSWEDKILKGQGQSYGIELFADKSKGRFTGWASYTLSWSNRVFSQINYGEKFPYAYDRRHQVKLALSYDLFEKQKSDKKIAHSVSSSFVFLSGNYVTFPTLEYHAQALPYQDNVDNIWNLSGRYIDGVNNFQMPNYQRLDLSYKIIIDKKNKRSIWDFGIYNVYNHMNVFYIYKSEDQIKQITFFPIIPSITFTHRF